MTDATLKNINRLTLAFAKAVGARQADAQDNLLVSPYNALMAMSMAAAGADGDTRAEMAKALFDTDAAGLDGAIDALMARHAEVMAANASAVTLKTANAIWTNAESTVLDESFVRMMKDKYGADISAEDFSSPDTVAKINAWAATNTNGMISDIIQQLDAQDRMVLASALYFKGEWTKKFDKALTVDDVFHADRANIVVPMMHQDFAKQQVFYQFGADYEAVAMTYGPADDASTAMILIRPTDPALSSRDWLAQQTLNADWLQTANYKDDMKGHVSMPRIDIKQRHDLVPSLRDMGIVSAFNQSSADFSKMIPANDVYISRVTHDVAFKTDEEGSEGAAVTTVTFRSKSVSIERTLDMRLDRSFVMVLLDQKTDTILFIGAVNNPVPGAAPAADQTARAEGQLNKKDVYGRRF